MKRKTSRRGRILVLEGPSGAGKSSLVRASSRKFRWSPVREAYDRLGRPDLDVRTGRELGRLERALLREDRRRLREATRLRDQGRTVVADTGFVGPLTYTAGLVALGAASRRLLLELEDRVRSRGRGSAWGLPDLLVYLEVPERERRRRVAGDPGSHPSGLDRRHAAVGRFERAFYRDLAPLLPAGAVRFVRAGRPLPAVVRELGTLAHAPAPDGAGSPLSFATFTRALHRRVRLASHPSRPSRHR